MKTLAAFLVILFSAAPASATFSIVAFDPVTGDLGVAVASRVFGVGNHVPWAEAGVGAVATIWTSWPASTRAAPSSWM